MPLAAAFDLPLDLIAGASASVSNVGRTLEKAKTWGEYIFAVQYKKVTKSSGLSASQPIKPTKDALDFERGNATINDAKQKDANFEDDDNELFEPAVEPSKEKEETLWEKTGLGELDQIEGQTRAVNEPKGSSDRSFRSPMAHLGLRNATLGFHQRNVGMAIQKEKSFICCCGSDVVTGFGEQKRSVSCSLHQRSSAIRTPSMSMVPGSPRSQRKKLFKFSAPRALGRV